MDRAETVASLAAAQGLGVEEVLVAARRAGVVAWSGHTPLDDEEASAIVAALAESVSAPPPPPLLTPGSAGGDRRLPPAPLAGVIAVLILLLGVGVVLLGGAGDDDGDTVEAASSRTQEDDTQSDDDAEAAEGSCVDLLVEAVNGLDLDDIDISDGLDDVERADLEGQMVAFESDHAELAAAGACEDALDDPRTADEFEARADPVALAALGAMATVRFDQVGEAIPGGGASQTAPVGSGVDRHACIALAAQQINAIDLSEVDSSDGFSEDELADITRQRFEFARLHPELQPDGECASVTSSLTGAELGELAELVLPDRRDLLVGI